MYKLFCYMCSLTLDVNKRAKLAEDYVQLTSLMKKIDEELKMSLEFLKNREISKYQRLKALTSLSLILCFVEGRCPLIEK